MFLNIWQSAFYLKKSPNVIKYYIYYSKKRRLKFEKNAKNEIVISTNELDNFFKKETTKGV